ncbi:MAG TPA: 1-phosphofructokinase [Ktedonobacteraceae bacterium]|nr:1-phosphofructokinase [Ktedonobacteraceae bacterium]
MKIATVTLNPAIDQTVRVDNFRPNEVNRAQAINFDASGKGVNVASFLTDYGYDVVVTGYLGVENRDIFEQFFAAKGIEDCFVRIPGNTRINVKVVDEVNQQTTDINMPGQTPPDEAIHTLLQTIEHLANSCDWFVLSGSLPPHVPVTIYATIINQLKRQKKHIILDTSGEALREGILAGPTIVKPNIQELQQLVFGQGKKIVTGQGEKSIGQSLTSEAEVQLAAHQLLNEDIALVVVSMGKQGAMLVEQATTLIATPPDITVKKTFGAGDAMVAGLVVAQIQGLSLADCGRLATAFSMGAIAHLSYNLPPHDILWHYAQQVDIRRY